MSGYRGPAEGLFVVHTIGGNRSQTSTDAWVDRHIFPNRVIRVDYC